ncbi:MAG: class I SAM-dependent methyltransferase [Taibaiella sp.]|nr:class I SAM-dependent methyltransferase [Taibaiella sp.]
MAGRATNDFPVQDIIEWDVRNWSRLMHYWGPVLEQLPRDSKVLAIGERNGGLSLWLALMGFRVTCTDITDVAASATPLHEKYGVEGRIEYRQLDIVNDEWEAEQFDIIIGKSVIGGVKPTRGRSSSRNFEALGQAMHNIHRLLKPGGYFFSAENLQGGLLNRYMRKRLNGGKGWYYLSLPELKGLFSAFNLVQTKTFGILPTFFSSKSVNMFMYFINSSLQLVLPKSSKYIAFTIARK